MVPAGGGAHPLTHGTEAEDFGIATGLGSRHVPLELPRSVSESIGRGPSHLFAGPARSSGRERQHQPRRDDDEPRHDPAGTRECGRRLRAERRGGHRDRRPYGQLGRRATLRKLQGGALRSRRDGIPGGFEAAMTTSFIRRTRIFVSGQLVEFWEDSEVTFGWTSEDLRRYADREEWVLLFNAMMLGVPGTEPGCGS